MNVLVQELSAKVQLPSPFMLVSLDGKPMNQLQRIHGIQGAQLFGSAEHGVRYHH